MTYIDYTMSGRRLLGERIAPHNIMVAGCNVRFDGDISNKAFDSINDAGLVTHSIVARRDFVCVSEDAALEVARILDANPVYAPPAVDHSRPRRCPDCGRKMTWDGRFFYCEYCEG